MSYTVIDISKYNVVNNYAILANAVDGVIIRLGYRAYRSGQLMIDPSFSKHIEGCIANKIPFGIYYFTTAVNENEAREEAKFAIDVVEKYEQKISFPIFIDTEMSNNNKDGRSDKLDKVTRTKCVVAFCEEVRKQGYVPGIYASDSWFVSQLEYEKVKNYKLWVASYSRSPFRVQKHIAWQFSSSQTVAGIQGRVDMSYWYDEIGNPKEEDKVEINPYLKPSTTVRKGMKGESVKWLQWELNHVGYNLKVDGDFGKKTLAAVKDFQKKKKLVVDGLVGPITIAALIGKSNKVSGNNILATAAIYSSNAKVDSEPKTTFEVGSEFIVTGINMYKFSFSIKPYTVVHGKCRVLDTKIQFGKVKAVKVATIEGECFKGWFKYKDIVDHFLFEN